MGSEPATSRGERKPIMEITEQLMDLDTIEVSVHGPQESYFEPTAALCSTCLFQPEEESDPEAER
jgi:hypothetical protein